MCVQSGGIQKTHLATPDTCERTSIRLAFWLAQGSMSCQSFSRISATLVFQVRFDRPAGRGVVLRPCAKSSITIPREADRNACEQEARLKSVYKAYPSHRPISTFEGQQNRSAHVCSHLCTILRFDTKCSDPCLGFIDGDQSHSRESPRVNDLLHSLHDVRFEDSRRLSVDIRSSLFACGPINRAVKHNNDGEEEPGWLHSTG
jgi:hypothetical protein